MRHRTMCVVLVAIATTLSLTGLAGAAFEDWAIGAKAGTLGIGGELTTNLAPDVHLRAGVQGLGFDFEAEFDDIDYDVDVDLLNPMLVLDWYPFSGSFRVSAGVVFNNSDISLEATSSQPIEIGGSTYDPADLGSIRGSPNVTLRATGPFANDPALLADLALEEEEIEDDLDVVRLYPVLSFTLYYRF